MKTERLYVLFGIDRTGRADFITSVIDKSIECAAATFGGTVKDADLCHNRPPFPGRQVSGTFMFGPETEKRLAQCERPDAPQDALSDLIETHRWAAGNCYLTYLIGTVPCATPDTTDRGRA